MLNFCKIRGKKVTIKSLVKPGSPLNRSNSGKIGHFQTFQVCTSHILVFGYAWSRCGRIVKKKYQKRFLVPRLLGIIYGGTSIGTSAAGGVCARNRPKQLVERTNNQNIEVLLFW